MRRPAVIAVGLIAATLVQGCAGAARRADPPPTPERLAVIRAASQAAQEAFDRRDWPRAQAELERLVAETPRSAEAHNRLGRVLLARNRPTEAEAAFRIALVIDPAYVDALIGLGRAALATGRLQEALRQLERAIDLEPARAEAHLARGNALESLGHSGEAQDAYFRALESDPGLASAAMRVAVLQLDAGRLDQALARLDGVVELTPDDPEARALRGRTNLALKNTAQAVEDLAFAAEKLPDRPEVFYALALALDGAKLTVDARKAAERAETLAPNWAEARELSAKLRR